MTETPTGVDGALRELADQIRTAPPSSGLTTAVLARVAAEPVPKRSAFRAATSDVAAWLRARLRWVVTLLVALGLGGAAVSPVGAEVADWFGFHGVVVTTGVPSPSGTPDVPPATGGLTVEEAATLVDFEPRIPDRLGPPDAVSVSPDRRLLSMSWQSAGAGAGTIRLDQFDAELSPLFWKQAADPVPVRVGAVEGLWFAAAHEVVVLDDSGNEETVPPRLAARTLIWAEGTRTFRLEGSFDKSSALEIAESAA